MPIFWILGLLMATVVLPNWMISWNKEAEKKSDEDLKTFVGSLYSKRREQFSELYKFKDQLDPRIRAAIELRANQI